MFEKYIGIGPQIRNKTKRGLNTVTVLYEHFLFQNDDKRQRDPFQLITSLMEQMTLASCPESSGTNPKNFTRLTLLSQKSFIGKSTISFKRFEIRKIAMYRGGGAGVSKSCYAIEIHFLF